MDPDRLKCTIDLGSVTASRTALDLWTPESDDITLLFGEGYPSDEFVRPGVCMPVCTGNELEVCGTSSLAPDSSRESLPGDVAGRSDDSVESAITERLDGCSLNGSE
jgi:hypothetical protein